MVVLVLLVLVTMLAMVEVEGNVGDGEYVDEVVVPPPPPEGGGEVVIGIEHEAVVPPFDPVQDQR